MCAQMLMHAGAHGGGTDTVRESALQVDSRSKLPCRAGDTNPRQYRLLLLAFQSNTLPARAIVSQSASQPVSQSASQPVSQSVSQPVSQSVSQPVSQSVSQSASQSVSQSVSQSASQSVSQPDQSR